MHPLNQAADLVRCYQGPPGGSKTKVCGVLDLEKRLWFESFLVDQLLVPVTPDD